MLANYHTHTYRCKHATGTDEEYILKAIAEGVKILGFSDHAPFIYPEGYVSYYKMTPDEASEYFASLSALRDKYADKIEIHIGYESEYYPELWERTFAFWKNENTPEYLILGQHYISEEYATVGNVHSYGGTDDPMILKKYVDLIVEGLSTKRFTYLAHPDVVSFRGSPDDYEREMTRLMTEVTKLNIPIELNLLGISEGRNYPTDAFWRIASKFSPRVILGCDAHDPESVADRSNITKALKYADKHSLNVIESLPLINPFPEIV